MARNCPRCGANYDATLFQFGHAVRCDCGAAVRYPGTDLRGGHAASDKQRPGRSAAAAKESSAAEVSTFSADAHRVLGGVGGQQQPAVVPGKQMAV